MKVERWVVWGCVVVGVVIGMVVLAYMRIKRGYYETAVGVARNVYDNGWRNAYARVFKYASSNGFEASRGSMERYAVADANDRGEPVVLEFLDMSRNFGRWLIVHTWPTEDGTIKVMICAGIGDNIVHQLLAGQGGKMPREVCEEVADVIAGAFGKEGGP